MAHTLTNKDLEAITQLASAIPPVRKHVKRRMTGAELHDLGVYTLNGQPVERLCSYMVDTILEANLVKVLTNICRKEGVERLHDAVDMLRNGRPHITKYGTLQFSTAA
jgi:hypothetical protein